MDNEHINYKEIDHKCIPLVKYFNSIGLPTKYSCQGHDNCNSNTFWIMFDDMVQDNEIAYFLTAVSNNSNNRNYTSCGMFVKWCRIYDDEVHYNWMYKIDFGYHKKNWAVADADLRYFESYYK